MFTQTIVPFKFQQYIYMIIQDTFLGELRESLPWEL